MTYDNLTIQWLAGFFDGEGCVYMQSDLRRNRHCYSLQISLTQNDEEILLAVQREYGGSVYQHSSGCYRWRVTNSSSLKFLIDIEPHLLLKKDQVHLAIEFIKTLRKDNLGSTPIDLKISGRRAVICQSLKDMKVTT